MSYKSVFKLLPSTQINYFMELKIIFFVFCDKLLSKPGMNPYFINALTSSYIRNLSPRQCADFSTTASPFRLNA